MIFKCLKFCNKTALIDFLPCVFQSDNNNTFKLFMRKEEKGTMLPDNVQFLLKHFMFPDFISINLSRITRRKNVGRKFWFISLQINLQQPCFWLNKKQCRISLKKHLHLLLKTIFLLYIKIIKTPAKKLTDFSLCNQKEKRLRSSELWSRTDFFFSTSLTDCGVRG